MNNVVDVEAIIARIKEVKGFASNQQVAEFLGVSKATVSNWVARNSIDFPLVIEKLKEVDLNWLLTGRGGPEHVPNHCDDERAEGEIQVIYESKIREKLDEDEAFWVADLNRPRESISLWEEHLPDIKPFYAMKCCDEPNLLKFLADVFKFQYILIRYDALSKRGEKRETLIGGR